MNLRKAAMRDIPAIARLTNGYAAQGIMLPRTELELAECIRDFSVVEESGNILGCCALHCYTQVAGEVRSLAVLPGGTGQGIGRALVQAIEREAAEFGLDSLFAFTYVPDFFRKLGYAQVDRGLLPQKAWKDCLRCPKFRNCDEISVQKTISSVPPAKPSTPELRVLPA